MYNEDPFEPDAIFLPGTYFLNEIISYCYKGSLNIL